MHSLILFCCARNIFFFPFIAKWRAPSGGERSSEIVPGVNASSQSKNESGFFLGGENGK